MKNPFKIIRKNFKQASRRWTWFLYRKRRILRAQFKDLLKSDNVKLHIGCGEKKLHGYINIDIVPTEGADVVMDVSKDLHLIPSDIASEIRLDSVFEHFYQYDQDRILKDFLRVLKKGGKLIINWLPDFDAVIDAYLKKKTGLADKDFNISDVRQHIYGEISHEDAPQELHKDLFTKDIIRNLLEHSGFYVEEIKNEVFPGEEVCASLNIIAVKK